MSTPAPRPALKKAADAHIHPAAPGHPAGALRTAAEVEAEAAARASEATTAAAIPVQRRLSGPLHGTTSDSLRAAGKQGRRRARQDATEKRVELTVKVPKTVRKDFRAALKADGNDADEVVTALLRTWLGG